MKPPRPLERAGGTANKETALSANEELTWVALSTVQVGDEILYRTERNRPALRHEQEDQPRDAFDWRTVAAISRDGRMLILSFTESPTILDAGHQYRLWVRRG